MAWKGISPASNDSIPGLFLLQYPDKTGQKNRPEKQDITPCLNH